MKVTSVKGTSDYLPKDARLRDYLKESILRTYVSNGFSRIYTPILEDIENLEKSDSGDNLSLIFKILKRGDKLTSAIDKKEFDKLSDLGLRYDLTLPLVRFYSGHKSDLLLPFKVIQIGSVYRAERPQKGRSREFTQCDIDIIGSESENCEIELIVTTAEALLNIGLKNFTVKISSRRILKDILSKMGFNKEDFNSVCITLDKLGKIGIDQVKEELTEKKFNGKAIDKILLLLKSSSKDLSKVSKVCDDKDETKRLGRIIRAVKDMSKGKYNIEFDLSLVRGQGYYTGSIFEIVYDSKDAIAGGGRYDNLIGKFIGSDVPAVGFSIGFERIFSLLRGRSILGKDLKKKLAIFYDDSNFTKCLKFSREAQEVYDTSLFEIPKKMGKFLSRLKDDDFYGFVVPSKDKSIREIKE